MVLNSGNEGTLDLQISGAETMAVDDGSVSMGKKFSERRFLRRVLGDYGSDPVRKLLTIAVHAVLLESGLIGFDSVSGMRVNQLHLANGWPSNSRSVSLWYTLPELLGNGYCNSGNVVELESVVSKFQSLGHLVIIHGCLAKGGSGLYRVCLNGNGFVPAINLANSDEETRYPESEILEFWKMVKDGLVLPLLIHLCEKTGLGGPPCCMHLPPELKLKIFESLPSSDLVKVGYVCSALRDLSSDNELWRQKFIDEFGGALGLGLPPCFRRISAELKLKIFQSLHGVDLLSGLRNLSSDNEIEFWKRKYDDKSGRAEEWKGIFALFWESKEKWRRQFRLFQ
ncbi:LOW QUALITY PROTEIN: F-box protein SKIP22-like [Corylus avellana]|uniref:LOW QUALITY PROTEIN: F-box protein SKIP22-like n=1 Tax=Corylus avellana TaxID=13451 RepID=UPI00286AB648|nr:LOW QUALITY PROTEIN: F-box protein SKIP22-like [Corylus avellana]